LICRKLEDENQLPSLHTNKGRYQVTNPHGKGYTSSMRGVYLPLAQNASNDNNIMEGKKFLIVLL